MTTKVLEISVDNIYETIINNNRKVNNMASTIYAYTPKYKVPYLIYNDIPIERQVKENTQRGVAVQCADNSVYYFHEYIGEGKVSVTNIDRVKYVKDIRSLFIKTISLVAQTIRYCKCGCGEKVSGANAYIRGHRKTKNKKSEDGKRFEDAMGEKKVTVNNNDGDDRVLCKCGCGEFAMKNKTLKRGHWKIYAQKNGLL